MAQELLSNCSHSIQKIRKLYVASRQDSSEVVSFPLEYNTISGSSDSIIRVENWDALNHTATIGGQVLQWNEVTILGDNADFTEELIYNKQGKVYAKKLNFTLPKVNYNTNAALKEFLFTSDGDFAICKAIAFVIDENKKQWIIGYDSPLILQDGMALDISPENTYKLSFASVSNSRIRNYQILP